jgi:hypothetical protein
MRLACRLMTAAFTLRISHAAAPTLRPCRHFINPVDRLHDSQLLLVGELQIDSTRANSAACAGSGRSVRKSRALLTMFLRPRPCTAAAAAGTIYFAESVPLQSSGCLQRLLRSSLLLTEDRRDDERRWVTSPSHDLKRDRAFRSLH